MTGWKEVRWFPLFLSTALAIGCGERRLPDAGPDAITDGRSDAAPTDAADAADAVADVPSAMDAADAADAVTDVPSAMDAADVTDAVTDVPSAMDAADVTDVVVDAATDAGTDVVDGAVDAFSCMPNAFLGCADRDTATFCNATGNGTRTQSCGGFGCNAAAMRCNECMPGTTSCQGDDVVVCDASGRIASRTMCALGCNPAARPTPQCLRVSPSNLPATTCDTPGTTDLSIRTAVIMNTDTGCDSVVTQTGAPEICVRKFRDVNVASTGSITVSGARALAIVATGTMVIDGVIDVSANGTTSGPGASSSSGVGGDASMAGYGGGGAGHGTAGAAGSSTTAEGAGGAGGMMYGTMTGVPLVGGAPGGRGATGGPLATQARGGGGGGAIQLVGCGTVTIGSTAFIDAGGGGGEGGPGTTSLVAPGGGGGGGSGGFVLIEGARVTIAGHVTANGGGGGGGGLRGSNPSTTGMPGGHGADGRRDAMPAAGGTGPAESGDGGSGGAGAMAPRVGQAPLVSSGAAGGGGGAAGRIRINVRTGTMPDTTGAVISPMPTVGAVGSH